MEETFDQKRRRLFGHLEMDAYLEVLQQIILQPIEQNNIISIPASDLFLAQKRIIISDIPFFRMTIRFEDREEQLSKVIELFFLPNEAFNLWTKYTDRCGLYRLSSLSFLNLSFPWDGIDLISLISTSFEKELVLDWYEEYGEHYLDISIYSSSRRFHKRIEAVKD